MIKSVNRYWYVYHPDAYELGLTAPTFNTEEEARAKCKEWNEELPGHYVVGIGEVPASQYQPKERDE